MGKITNIVVAGIVALVVAFGAVVVFKPEAVPPSFGGTNPDIPSAYLKWGSGGGVRLYPASMAFNQATTTICSFLSPNATSTLVSAGVKVDLASSTATTLVIAKATNPTASTTALSGTYSIGAGAQAFVEASTSPAVLATTVFAPLTYLNVTLTGGTGTFSGTGVCHATFEEYVNL